MPAPYKVILWGPGQLGKEALRTIIDRSDLELVGVRAYSEQKDGVDAGDLCDREPVGVTATRDVERLLALAPDCVCFTAYDRRIDVHVDDVCAILRRGINVCTAGATAFAHPPLLPDETRRIEEAALAGGSAFYLGGLNPGFCGDVLPILLATSARRVEAIEIAENFDFSTYRKDPVGLARFGFGRSLEDWTPEEYEELATYYWAPCVHLVGRALGATEYEIRITTEATLADESFVAIGKGSSAAPTGIRVDAGTISAVHCTIELLVEETPRVIYHEYICVGANPATDPWPARWPAPPGGLGALAPGGYRVRIDAEPSVHADIWFESAGSPDWLDGDHFGGGMIAAAVRLANMIPLVCEAPPGYYTPTGLTHSELTPATVGHWYQPTALTT